MSDVVIFGAGQLAEVAWYYLTHDSEHQVVAFTVDAGFLKEDSFHGLPVFAWESLPEQFPPTLCKLLLPISYRNTNQVRADKFAQATQRGYQCVSYISSCAIYYDTPIGSNCMILENNVIQPFTRIGDNCILWSGNHLGHHSVIEDHCFVASHAVISGSVTIGEGSFIGVNATIRDNIHIGRQNVIGAGALVLKDTPDQAVLSPGSTPVSGVPSSRLPTI